MKLRLPISLSLLLLAEQLACAQTAEDFFNHGAQFYISNNIPAALQKVEDGLKVFPGDEKLKELEKLLKQQQQQSQQQPQKNQQRQQNQKEQQKNQSNEKKQEQQKQQEQQSQKPQEQKKKSEKKKQEASKPSDEEKKPPNENPEQASGSAAGQMTPQEAKRLLDSQKGNEKLLPVKPKTPPANENRVVKDW